MRRDGVGAETIAQVAGQPFGETACVDEDDRRGVVADERSKAVVILLPHLVRHHGVER